MLYFGGDVAITDEEANGYAKIVENDILIDMESKLPAYSITYNFADYKTSQARKIDLIKHPTEVLATKESIDAIKMSSCTNKNSKLLFHNIEN